MEFGGTTRAPELTGRAEVIRGDYSFAGKRFDFQPNGYVELSTNVSDMRLNLEAVYNPMTSNTQTGTLHGHGVRHGHGRAPGDQAGPPPRAFKPRTRSCPRSCSAARPRSSQPCRRPRSAPPPPQVDHRRRARRAEQPARIRRTRRADLRGGGLEPDRHRRQVCGQQPLSGGGRRRHRRAPKPCRRTGGS